MSILQNNKKAAAGIGVVAAAAAVLALGAGTYAAFTDTENAQATFAAGTLDLELGGTGAAGQVSFENLVPGQVIPHKVSIANVGNIDGVLSFTAELTESDGVCTEPEETEGGGCGPSLADAITVSVPGAGERTLADLRAGVTLDGIALPAESGERPFTLTFTVSEEAANEIQGDTATVDIVATLTQAD